MTTRSASTVATARRAVRSPVALEPLELRTLFSAALLGDINTTPQTADPIELVEVNGTLFFSARDDAHGRELYRSDGTAAGTSLLKDIAPLEASSNPSELTVVNGRLFFAAGGGDDGYDHELWTSDGTEAGTVRVKDIYPGTEPAWPERLVDVGGTLFFTARDPVHGSELWKSDGTEAGTVMVKDLDPGRYAPPMNLTAAGATLFFTTIIPDTAEAGLYKSDGTETGTVLVKDLGEINRADAWNLTAVGDTLFFSAATPETGRELWKSDGTEAGTVLVKDIKLTDNGTYTGGSYPAAMADVGGTLYFSADDGVNGQELWKSDGTPDGTVMVKDLRPGGPIDHSFPRAIMTFDGAAYFTLSDTTTSDGHANGLYRTDGTDAGTVLVHPARVRITSLIEHGGRLFFTSGQELWTSDGTTAGTVLLRRFPLTPGDPAPFRGGVAFSAAPQDGSTVYERELWFSDGTAAGTALVGDVNPDTAGSDQGVYVSPVTVGGRVVFAAHDGNNDRLWATDGTTAGTMALSSPGPVPFDGLEDVAGLTAADGVAYALAGRTSSRGLWRTDGTPAGTVRVKQVEFEVPAGRDSVESFVAAGGAVYFSARAGSSSQTSNYELFRSDGTPEGTRLVKDIVAGPGGSFPRNLTAVGDTLYFTVGGVDLTMPQELWKTDGTEAGTVRVKSFAGIGKVNTLAAVGGRLFLRGSGLGGEFYFASDGTDAGTILFGLVPGARPSFGEFFDLNGVALFAADANDGRGAELWRSDGTPAGTTLVADINTGLRGSGPHGFARVEGGAVFRATDRSGQEWWRTDGTPEGTYLLRDIRPGPAGSDTLAPAYAVAPAVVGGRVFLPADDGTHGWELWETDGTRTGTRLAEDLVPGPLGAHPLFLAPLGDGGGASAPTLFAFLDDTLHGREPWAITPDPVPPPAAAVVAHHVFYDKAPGFDRGGPEGDDAAIATDKQALLPGQSPSFSNVTSYAHGLNGVMVDIANLPAGGALSPADFDIGGDGTRVMDVSVRRGAGTNGSDRVTLTWPDYDTPTDPPTIAVGNGWLRITLKANANTGLSAPDVFSFGNLIGDTGDSPTSFRVNALDLAAVKRALNSATTVTSPTDFNRDGRTNALDLATVKRALNQALAIPPAPAPAQRAEGVRRVADEVLASA